ncbi:MAG: DUF1588 domain-containing protein [Myxococcota bacterium]
MSLLMACTGSIGESGGARGPDGRGPDSRGPDGSDPMDPTGPGARGRPPSGGMGDGVNPVTLDQATLFTCTDDQTLTPQRIWRVSGPQFTRMQAAVQTTSRDLIDPFGGSFSGKTFANYAEPFSVAEPELGVVRRAGRVAAIKALNDNKMPGCARSAYRDAIAGDTTDPLVAVDAGCRESMARWVFLRAARRPLTDEEAVEFAERFASFLETLGTEQGLIVSITSLFGHPEALFRSEIGEPVGDGRNRLTANELGVAASLTLTNRAPLATRMLDIVEDGSILDPEVYRNALSGLMDQDSYSDVMVSFLDEYFQFSVGREILKPHRMGYAFRDRPVRAFLHSIIEDDTDFVRQLLTSTRMFDNDGEPLADDPTRPGILNRQAWLVSFSDNEDNDPIHRGYFIREQLLCQSIPEIPIGVVPQLPEGEDMTLRERLSEHTSNRSCRSCHDRMDPLGLTFEGFDHYGLPRDEEAGRPVDTSGHIYSTGTSLDGPLADSRELVERLGGAEDVERCFVRHLFRFVNGRDETYGDSCTLNAAHEAYQSSGGSLRATLTSLMTSDTFLYRSTEAP